MSETTGFSSVVVLIGPPSWEYPTVWSSRFLSGYPLVLPEELYSDLDCQH
ncbi:hypothetical protein [Paenibacillus larvae]